MTPTLESLRIDPFALQASARRARAEALHDILVQLLARLSWRKLFGPDESLGRPQWG